MKIVFGIMSAVHSQETVAQLAQALAPHPVVVHHDFSQQRDFDIDAPNVSFISNPKPTGWDDWGFCVGIFRLLGDCFADPTTDYFQLLSPTCLPLRPIDEFVAMVESNRHDAHNEFFDLTQDDDALLNFAYRAFAPAGSLRCRALWRCLQMWTRVPWQNEDRCNLQIRVLRDRPDVAGRIGRWLAKGAAHGIFGRHPFNRSLRPLVGGTWFGANRLAAERMLEGFAQPSILKWFSDVHLADEMLISTLLGNSGCRMGPSNHFVNEFSDARPRWITGHDLPMAQASGRFFGRKFADDANDPVRLEVLRGIGAL